MCEVYLDGKLIRDKEELIEWHAGTEKVQFLKTGFPNSFFLPPPPLYFVIFVKYWLENECLMCGRVLQYYLALLHVFLRLAYYTPNPPC